MILIQVELTNMDLKSISSRSLPDPHTLQKSSHLLGPKVLPIAWVRDPGRGDGPIHNVDANVEYCSVIKTKLRAHRILMGAEMDCCDSTDDGRRFYVELKTSHELDNHKIEYEFEKEKLLKFWDSLLTSSRGRSWMQLQRSSVRRKLWHTLASLRCSWPFLGVVVKAASVGFTVIEPNILFGHFDFFLLLVAYLNGIVPLT
ncbi:hypothetical protein ACFXTI_005754 [Malus domestica]